VVIAAGLMGMAAFSRVETHKANAARAESERRALQVRRELMHTAADLGSAQLAAGDQTGAFTNFNRAFEIAQELLAAEAVGGGQPLADTMTALAEYQARLGEVLLASGAKRAALTRLEKARDQYRQLTPRSETQAALAKLDRMIVQTKE
jgi:tetratricopeptide (TPR) repeat protein